VTAEPTTEPTEPTPTPEPSAETSAGDRLPDDHPVVKALHKANEEAKQARLKVKEYEDRDKTESERTSEKLSTLEKELTTAQADRVRFEIALDKGLTKSQARRLVGSTREELEADAAQLVEDLGLTDRPDVSRRPQERLKPGAAPDAEPAKTPEELADAVVKRQRGF
jgi:hypothetical protein